MKDINSPAANDNRSYDYTNCPTEMRAEYSYFLNNIPRNSTVIDLGCGNGSLMQLLQSTCNAQVEGIEISESGVAACTSKGLKVSQGRIDCTLPYADKQFDFAVCNVTMQMVEYPEILMAEMARIAKYQIVTFPNFAFYKNRVELLFKGRMPKKGLFGYKWYSTGHIHQLSNTDFKELINDIGGLHIMEETTMPHQNPLVAKLQDVFPNVFSVLSIFKLYSQV